MEDRGLKISGKKTLSLRFSGCEKLEYESTMNEHRKSDCVYISKSYGGRRWRLGCGDNIIECCQDEETEESIWGFGVTEEST